MKIGGEYTFDGPRDAVWQALQDPVVLASVLPGCEKLDLIGENEYEGALKIKVGPVQGAFQGKVKLEDIQPPESYTMQVDGRGAPGFVKATGHLKLTDGGATTQLAYDGDAQVGGRLASVGQRLMESSAKAIIRQSLDGLNEAIRARATTGPGAPDVAATATAADAVPPSPKPKTPSQTEFAASVAREVAKDLIPAPARWALGIAALALVLWLLYALLT